MFSKVANELGFGFLESVYQSAMLVALREAGIEAREQVPIGVSFHGVSVGKFFAHILVEGVLILELKTAGEITKSAEAQLLNYLRATPIEMGPILSFGERALIRRLNLTDDRKPNLHYISPVTS